MRKSSKVGRAELLRNLSRSGRAKIESVISEADQIAKESSIDVYAVSGIVEDELKKWSQLTNGLLQSLGNLAECARSKRDQDATGYVDSFRRLMSMNGFQVYGQGSL